MKARDPYNCRNRHNIPPNNLKYILHLLSSILTLISISYSPQQPFQTCTKDIEHKQLISDIIWFQNRVLNRSPSIQTRRNHRLHNLDQQMCHCHNSRIQTDLQQGITQQFDSHPHNFKHTQTRATSELQPQDLPQQENSKEQSNS